MLVNTLKPVFFGAMVCKQKQAPPSWKCLLSLPSAFSLPSPRAALPSLPRPTYREAHHSADGGQQRGLKHDKKTMATPQCSVRTNFPQSFSSFVIIK